MIKAPALFDQEIGGKKGEVGRFCPQTTEGGYFRRQFNHAVMLMGQGAIDAPHWLTRMKDSATPAILQKTAAWMAEQSDPIWHRDLASALQDRSPAQKRLPPRPAIG